jgi:hypothetical protein
LQLPPTRTAFVAKSVMTTAFAVSRCFDRGDRLYMYDRHRDYYYDHRSPSIELYGPGIGVEIR